MHIAIGLERYDVDEKITFADIGESDFFLTDDGWLCQKIHGIYYNSIIDADGRPFAQTYKMRDTTMIVKVFRLLGFEKQP